MGYDLFNRPVMIKWNKKTPAQKTYMHVVTFFTKQLRVIKNFEAAGGGASKRQGFESANVVAEFQTVCVNHMKNNKIPLILLISSSSNTNIGVLRLDSVLFRFVLCDF